jgi:hypothetical protein
MLLMKRVAEARITECIFMVASFDCPRDLSKYQREADEHRSGALRAGRIGSGSYETVSAATIPQGLR